MSSLILYGSLIAAVSAALVALKPCGLTTRGRALGMAALFVAIAAGAWFWPPPVARPARGRRLIDAALPRYQFAERHRTKICATPEKIAAALRSVPPSEIRWLGLLSSIRGLGLAEAPDDKAFLDIALESNFVLLADTPVELVLATAGEFWRMTPLPEGHPLPALLKSVQQDVSAFAALDPGGGAPKAVINFVIEGADFGCQTVTTETRIYAAGPAMQRRFAAYWRVIQPGSALLRRSWLDAVRARAEGRAH